MYEPEIKTGIWDSRDEAKKDLLFRYHSPSAFTIMSYSNICVRTGFLNLKKKDAVKVTYVVNEDPVKNFEQKQSEEQAATLMLQAEANRALDRKVIDALRQEIVNLRNDIEQKAVIGQSEEKRHPTLELLDDILTDNEFSREYKTVILDSVRKEFSLSALDNCDEVKQAVLNMIGDNISIETLRARKRPEIIILVGPTGVGKTTTIAKLAAAYKIGLMGLPMRSVGIITIDQYKIGGFEQIKKYGEMMDILVKRADTKLDLEREISFFSDLDVIIVDTIGKSPNAYIDIGKMQEVLSACSTNAVIYLTLSAATKTNDLISIIKQYEPFCYNSIIVTKLDETNCVGNVLSALAATGKSVSWITNGQGVPNNIAKAHQLNFLLNLKGFSQNRPTLEERYGTLPN